MSVLELLKASTIISESNSIKLAAGFPSDCYPPARNHLKLWRAVFSTATQTHQFPSDMPVADGLRAAIESLENNAKLNQKAVLEFVEGMAPKAGSGISSVTIQVKGREPVVLTPETRVKAKAKLEELKQTGFQPEPTPEAVTGIRLIALEQIIADESVQSRAQLDMIAVSEYAAALEDGNQDLPPVIVFADGSSYWLSDGYHRHAAHKAAGRTEINCDVRLGNKRAALLHSAGSNQQHGLRRTNSDKRRAVEMVLRDPEWATWTDRAIGLHCDVDGKTVATVRIDLEFAGEIKPQDVRTTTAGKAVTAKKSKPTSSGPGLGFDREPRASTEHGSTQGDTRRVFKTVTMKSINLTNAGPFNLYAVKNDGTNHTELLSTIKSYESSQVDGLSFEAANPIATAQGQMFLTLQARSWMGSVIEVLGDFGIVDPGLEIVWWNAKCHTIEQPTSNLEPDVTPLFPNLETPEILAPLQARVATLRQALEFFVTEIAETFDDPVIAMARDKNGYTDLSGLHMNLEFAANRISKLMDAAEREQ